MLSFLLFLGGLSALVYYVLKKNYSYWKSLNVPFAEPVFLLGNFKNVALGKQHMFEITKEIYKKFRDLGHPYVGVFTFHRPSLLIMSPDLIRNVLVKDFDKFVNRSIARNESVDPLAANTLFAAHDSLWKNTRNKLTPVFTSGKIKLMLTLMKECGKDLNDYFDRHNGESLDLRMVTKKYSVDIISSCAFGIDSYCLKSEEQSEMLKHATKLIDPNSIKRSLSLLCFFFVPKLVDIFRLTFTDTESADYLYKIFLSTLRAREENNIVRHDLIDLLNNLKKNDTTIDNYKFDDFKMAAQAISFFGAGNDTTSSIITFALYELAVNNDIQVELRGEIRKVLANTAELSYEDIQGMKYLDMVLSETLRKYPLTTFLNREASSSYTFAETGLTIPQGLSVQIPVAGLHYDPEYYPQPEKFLPERFSDENKGRIPPYTYLPFGEGPRNCIGQRFGLLVSKVALVYALKDFKFEVCGRTSVPLHFNPRVLFLQNKGGLFLKVVKVA